MNKLIVQPCMMTSSRPNNIAAAEAGKGLCTRQIQKMKDMKRQWKQCVHVRQTSGPVGRPYLSRKLKVPVFDCTRQETLCRPSSQRSLAKVLSHSPKKRLIILRLNTALTCPDLSDTPASDGSEALHQCRSTAHLMSIVRSPPLPEPG